MEAGVVSHWGWITNRWRGSWVYGGDWSGNGDEDNNGSIEDSLLFVFIDSHQLLSTQVLLSTSKISLKVPLVRAAIAYFRYCFHFLIVISFLLFLPLFLFSSSLFSSGEYSPPERKTSFQYWNFCIFFIYVFRYFLKFCSSKFNDYIEVNLSFLFMFLQCFS